jgi:hypothetical protein
VNAYDCHNCAVGLPCSAPTPPIYRPPVPIPGSNGNGGIVPGHMMPGNDFRGVMGTPPIRAMAIPEWINFWASSGLGIAAVSLQRIYGLLGEEGTRHVLSRILNGPARGMDLGRYMESQGPQIVEGVFTSYKAERSRRKNNNCGQQAKVAALLCSMLKDCASPYHSVFTVKPGQAEGFEGDCAGDQIRLHERTSDFVSITALGHLVFSMFNMPTLQHSEEHPASPTPVTGANTNTFTFTAADLAQSATIYGVEVKYTTKLHEIPTSLEIGTSSTNFVNALGQSVNFVASGSISYPSGGYLYALFGVDDGTSGDSARTQIAENPAAGTNPTFTVTGFPADYTLTGRVITVYSEAHYRLLHALIRRGIVR